MFCGHEILGWTLPAIKLGSIVQRANEGSAGEIAREIFSLFKAYRSKDNSPHSLRGRMENAQQGYISGNKPPWASRSQRPETAGPARFFRTN
jgi:hypothetical protein